MALLTAPAPSSAPDALRTAPRHVAIIMDGNGRWAKARGLPRLWGHRQGAESVRVIVRLAAEVGVEALTLYAFSTENWRRPAGEIAGLMRLLVHTLKREVKNLNENNVRLEAIGRLGGLPVSVRKELDAARAALSGNRGLRLTLALNYGSRQEIVDAVRAWVKEGLRDPRDVTEEGLSARLYTAGLPDPDLIIRTSGEFRLSNFLLWQAAYAEIVISPVYWPDFRRAQFLDALAVYQNRERRFGRT
jgi:undecaprenyl diphosphate synthase